MEKNGIISFVEFCSGNNIPVYTPITESLLSNNNNYIINRGGYFLEEVSTSIDTFIASKKKRRRVKPEFKADKKELVFVNAPVIRLKIKVKKKRGGVKKGLRRICKIASKKGMGFINYKELVKKINCIINLLDLL